MTTELLFVPLGGASEIGMNLNLYGFGQPGDHRWLMIDLGVSFGGGVPGVDVFMPDPAFIAGQREHLDGILLTHAHEDHLGAVPYLWPRLRCPIWASGFTLELLKRKLDEVPWGKEVPLNRIPDDGQCRIGAFEVEMIDVTHSIPEASAVAVRTPVGTIVHTGDWKFDPDPVVGPTSDEDALRRFGDAGVLAIVCDSTNVFERGTSGSEGALLDSLTRLIAGIEGRVVVSCFATNVARLQTIATAARANGRDVVLAGRSLQRTYAVARACGYLEDIPAFVDAEDGAYLPRDRMLIISTGGQGEPRAALMRLALDEHPSLQLDAGDAVVFSSRVIPGNEVPIGRLQNQLLRRGIDVLTHRDGLVHVSGHPARGELAHMYALVRPRAAIPVHGELRHLREHAKVARESGVQDVVVGENGSVIRLWPGPAQLVDTVPAGRLALEGKRLVPMGGSLISQRTRALYNGTALVTVTVNGGTLHSEDVQLSSIGLVDDGEEKPLIIARNAVVAAVTALPKKARDDDEALRETIRLAVRRCFRQLFDKRPVTHVHLVRIED
jgi:Predicted hydrolase of the metallo-beta-lactamase superfamily